MTSFDLLFDRQTTFVQGWNSTLLVKFKFFFNFQPLELSGKGCGVITFLRFLDTNFFRIQVKEKRKYRSGPGIPEFTPPPSKKKKKR